MCKWIGGRATQANACRKSRTVKHGAFALHGEHDIPIDIHSGVLVTVLNVLYRSKRESEHNQVIIIDLRSKTILLETKH